MKERIARFLAIRQEYALCWTQDRETEESFRRLIAPPKHCLATRHERRNA